MRPYDIRFEPRDIVLQDWYGFPIRFAYYDGEWWAVLKDVCDALDTRVDKVTDRIEPYDLLLAVIPSFHHLIRGVKSKGRGIHPHHEMYIVNLGGILDIVNRSRSDAARKFRYWVKHIITELRQDAGLEGYEIGKLMFDREVQRDVDKRYGWEPSDDIWYDEERDRVYTEIRMDRHGNPIDPDEDYYR